MTESSKSKLWWFAILLVRLVGVFIGCVFLSFLLNEIFLLAHKFLGFGFNSSAAFWVTAICILVGYTWAIYFDFPFFQSRTKRQRLFISAGIGLLSLFVTFGCVFVVLAQLFQDFRRAQFASPANSANQIWFYDGGFLDRDLFLCAKPEGQKARRVFQLEETGEYGFSDARWTKDGQVFVCSLEGRIIGNAPIAEIAYDFGTHKTVFRQPFGSNTETNEPTMGKIIVMHGGLSDQRIDDDMVRKNEKQLWFWQKIPES